VCTQWNTALPGATLAVSGNAVVTVFRVRTATALQVRLRVLRGSPSAMTVVTSTPFATFPGTNVASGIDVRVPVRAGDVLALGLAVGYDFPYAVTSGAGGACFNPAQAEPADGATQPAMLGCSGNEEFLYNATVEPDADGDGWGDETQDLCAGSAGPASGCPLPSAAPPAPAAGPNAPDLVKPVISGLSVSNPVFRVDNAAQAAQTRPTPRGTSLRFTLSEAATVAIGIEQRATGRRVEGRCRTPSSKSRTRPRCTRYVVKRTFRRSLPAGPNAIAFSGRIRVPGDARALKPGRYRAVLRARDAAGNVAARAAVVGFRIIR